MLLLGFLRLTVFAAGFFIFSFRCLGNLAFTPLLHWIVLISNQKKHQIVSEIVSETEELSTGLRASKKTND